MAIICACLPMCRLPLTYLFPTVFGSQQGSTTGSSSGKRSNNSTFVHAGTGRNEWSPYQGREEKRGRHSATVQGRSRLGDDASEEYILGPVGERGGASVDLENGNAIRKTMAFQMTSEQRRD